ncbi:MAG: hypothetical protein BWK80_61525 [Desulfobacteraceae bacterium IS3]|nr:MAG: hypothetical protein BWK80_61525 [Desulfobacteraceae bacterium IS3]
MEVRSIEAIVRALQEARVRYLVVGGLAVNAHGYERFTSDIDLVIGLKPQNVIRGLKALMSVGYHTSIPVSPEAFADADQREAWRRDKQMLVLKMWSDIHAKTPIDIFVYEPFDFEVEYCAAQKECIAEGLFLPVIRYEALIVMKKEAGRLQDLADIENLERIQQLKREG